jgi:phage shock protein PspC (stress-responsive transcriptional regulator)
MKKNFAINIGGRLFHIDEDAYELLEEYFGYLDHNFSDEAEKQEIIDDFQKRISDELWDLTKNDAQHIVNIIHVKKVLAGLGYYNKDIPVNEQKNRKSGYKRLFRNPDNRIFGGVCGGIAVYFNIDPLIVRIIFIIFTLIFAVGLFAYLILWIVVPPAVSPIDKLNMSGDEITLEKVKKIIKDEFKEVEKSIRDLKKKGIRKERLSDVEKEIRDFLNASVFFRAFIGGILIAIALFLITGLVILLLFPLNFGTFQGMEINSFSKIGLILFHAPIMGPLLKWALFFMFFIPFAGILLFGLSILTGITFQTGMIRWLSQYFGTLCLMIIIFSIAFIYIQFLFQSKQQSILLYSANYYREIKIELADREKQDLQGISGIPEVLIVPGGDTLKAVIQKRSFGRTNSIAVMNAGSLKYDVRSKNDTIFIGQRWYSESHVWRGQNVRLTLFIPVGKRFTISNSFAGYFLSFKQDDAEQSKRFRYKMTQDGPVRI